MGSSGSSGLSGSSTGASTDETGGSSTGDATTSTTAGPGSGSSGADMTTGPGEGDSEAAVLVAGEEHNCVITKGGDLLCWGDSTFGQLGSANSNNIGDNPGEMPPPKALLGGAAVAQVAPARIHTCALFVGGGVRCWGHPSEGALGFYFKDEDGLWAEIGDEEEDMPPPEVDLGGLPAVSIAAGDSHSCAALAGGTVTCWGDNTNGQLGRGDTASICDDPGEKPLAGVDLGGVIVQLAASGSTTCALLEGGAVKCWGANESGQLGRGDTESIGDEPGEMPPADVDLGGAAVQISVGRSQASTHVCALMANGAVRCWGAGEYGRLGYGDQANIGDEPGEMPPADVDLGGAAVQISAGGLHTCALMASGAVRCWGAAIWGQIGYGSDEDLGDEPGEMPPPDVDLGGPAVQVAAGRVHTCFLLEDGGVKCVGFAAEGQLGQGDLTPLGDNPWEMPPPYVPL